MTGVMGVRVGGVSVPLAPTTAKRVVLAEKGHNLKIYTLTIKIIIMEKYS